MDGAKARVGPRGRGEKRKIRRDEKYVVGVIRRDGPQRCTHLRCGRGGVARIDHYEAVGGAYPFAVRRGIFCLLKGGFLSTYRDCKEGRRADRRN